MTDKIRHLHRVTSGKPTSEGGLGNFYGEYEPGLALPRLELRYRNGWRVSVSYYDITEINLAPLEGGLEDIIMFSQYKFLIRIIGKNMSKLFDALHLNNVAWLREARDNEQYDPEAFHIENLVMHAIDDWAATLDKLEGNNKKKK